MKFLLAAIIVFGMCDIASAHHRYYASPEVRVVVPGARVYVAPVYVEPVYAPPVYVPPPPAYVYPDPLLRGRISVGGRGWGVGVNW